MPSGKLEMKARGGSDPSAGRARRVWLRAGGAEERRKREKRLEERLVVVGCDGRDLSGPGLFSEGRRSRAGVELGEGRVGGKAAEGEDARLGFEEDASGMG
jgi:hypothetical protein